jgi:hypothetical protein
MISLIFLILSPFHLECAQGFICFRDSGQDAQDFNNFDLGKKVGCRIGY